MGLSSPAPFLTVREVARRLRVRPVTVYRLCERGELAHLRVSNAIRIRPEDLDAYLPPGRALCEVRLLAIEPDRRRGAVLAGLLRLIHDYFVREGYDLAVISATLRQTKLYERLGFVPFGPQVGTPEAPYQPMYLTRETFETRMGWEPFR